MSDNASTHNSSTSTATGLQVLYAGCLDSDPFFSLKSCDRFVVEGLRKKGVEARALNEELPLGKLFRKLNRKFLYPRLIAKAANSPISDFRPLSSGILHISSQCYAHLIPKSKCPVSVTVHDVAEFDYPEGYTAAQHRRVMKRLSCIKDADLIFTISEFTKQELIEKAEVPAEKIIVNHNGVDPAFRPLEFAEAETLRPDMDAFKGRHFLVLATGANIYRKNLLVLLQAVEILRSRGAPVLLIKTGESLSTTHSSQLTTLGLAHCVYDLGYVSQKELVALYNLCDALAFPSLYEGFGLPVVEAQKCGLPCVISNTSSLPEIGGDGALYHDPEDAEQLANQLQRVYEDETLRDNLRTKGFENSERFSWDRHVDTLIKGFGELL